MEHGRETRSARTRSLNNGALPPPPSIISMTNVRSLRVASWRLAAVIRGLKGTPCFSLFDAIMPGVPSTGYGVWSMECLGR